MNSIGKLRYVTSEMLAHYDEPIWWHERFIDRVIHPIHANVYPTYENAIEVAERDWDNLIILDGCRLDLFEEWVNLKQFDSFDSVLSYGSSTPEWTHQNFRGREFGDIVYVTSNPWTTRVAGDAFHDVIEVWRENFDENLGTVPENPVTEAAYDAVEEYPNKRLIVHFMQPHAPFVSPEFEYTDWSPQDIVNESGGDTKSRRTVWEALRRGDIDRDSAWQGYGENLQYVMERVKDLGPSLPGRTVVSSDHGNMLGERSWPVPLRIYGHPAGLRSSPLIEVPWAVFEGERREIVDETVTDIGTGDVDELEDRLAALGYK